MHIVTMRLSLKLHYEVQSQDAPPHFIQSWLVCRMYPFSKSLDLPRCIRSKVKPGFRCMDDPILVSANATGDT